MLSAPLSLSFVACRARQARTTGPSSSGLGSPRGAAVGTWSREARGSHSEHPVGSAQTAPCPRCRLSWLHLLHRGQKTALVLQGHMAKVVPERTGMVAVQRSHARSTPLELHCHYCGRAPRRAMVRPPQTRPVQASLVAAHQIAKPAASGPLPSLAAATAAMAMRKSLCLREPAELWSSPLDGRRRTHDEVSLAWQCLSGGHRRQAPSAVQAKHAPLGVLQHSNCQVTLCKASDAMLLEGPHNQCRRLVVDVMQTCHLC